MGQKTNPIGNRLGIIRGWNSNWYGGRDYGDKLAEDNKIRKYINVRLSKASVSNIIIERTLKLITVTILKYLSMILLFPFFLKIKYLAAHQKGLWRDTSQQKKAVY